MRNRWKIAGPCLNLLAGLVWLYIALRNFDRLTLLDGYHLPEYRGLHSRGGDVLFPCMAGLLFLIGAAVGFLSWMRKRGGEAEPAVIRLFGSESR